MIVMIGTAIAAILIAGDLAIRKARQDYLENFEQTRSPNRPSVSHRFRELCADIKKAYRMLK